MSDWTRLERFLHTDPRDVGCDEAMAVLHIRVELTAAQRAQRYPGVLAYLLACRPCADDVNALLATVDLAG